MIKNLKSIISFGAGLGIGILSGKVYYEKKYQMKLKGEKFNSDTKETKTSEKPAEEKPKENVEEKDPKESSEINKNKDDLSEMAKKVMEDNPRVDYSTPAPGEKKIEHTEEPSIEEDFELEPEDFGERGDEDYETLTVLYLADGNLVYENGNLFEPVDEPQRKIGSKALAILRNDPSDDVMYVRNKRLKIDYEIVMDDRTLNEGISDEDDEDDELDETIIRPFPRKASEEDDESDEE